MERFSDYKLSIRRILLSAVLDLYKQDKRKQAFQLLKIMDCGATNKAIARAFANKMRRHDELQAQLTAVRSTWVR